MKRKIVKNLPKDAKYIGTTRGWRARALYYSPSKKEYYEAMTLAGIQKGYDVSDKLSLSTRIIPKGFHFHSKELRGMI